MYDSQYSDPQYRKPPERQLTMPMPDTSGGYGYSAHTNNQITPYHSQTGLTSPSSPWFVPSAGSGCQSSLPHGQAGGNFPLNGQWEVYDTSGGLMSAHAEAPSETHVWQQSQLMHASQNYPYPPHPAHAATMSPLSYTQLSSSPPDNFQTGGSFPHPSTPPMNATHYSPSPQVHGYPVETAAGETDLPDYSPTASNLPRSMSVSGMVTTGVAILHHGIASYRVPIENANGDPRGQQSTTQSAGKPKPKPKPGQYVSQLCIPEHETMPPSRRGTF